MLLYQWSVTAVHCDDKYSHPITSSDIVLQHQVWRPLKGPVNDSPLGMIDASTTDKDDLMQYALHFPGRTGYNYAVKHNPKHK